LSIVLIEIRIELKSRLHVVDIYDDVGYNLLCLFREPKWNKTVNCMTMPGTKFLDVEIYDECTFSTGKVPYSMYLLLSIVYSLLCTVYWYSILLTAQCILDCLLCTMYCPSCTLHWVLSVVYFGLCIFNCLFCTVLPACCGPWNLYCLLYFFFNLPSKCLKTKVCPIWYRLNN